MLLGRFAIAGLSAPFEVFAPLSLPIAAAAASTTAAGPAASGGVSSTIMRVLERRGTMKHPSVEFWSQAASARAACNDRSKLTAIQLSSEKNGD
jgi:hypothetical protein